MVPKRSNFRSHQAAIFQAFKSTYGTAPLEVAVTTWVTMLEMEMILRGNSGELGKYTVLSVLQDKIARFLYEYNDTSYTSLGLPPIPLDRSGIMISVHCILQPDQVQL
jgi:hypothetical protein